MNEEEEGVTEFIKTEIKEEFDTYNYSPVETDSLHFGGYLKQEIKMMNEEEEGLIEFTKSEVKEEFDTYLYSSAETDSFDVRQYLKKEENESVIPSTSKSHIESDVPDETATDCEEYFNCFSNNIKSVKCDMNDREQLLFNDGEVSSFDISDSDNDVDFSDTSDNESEEDFPVNDVTASDSWSAFGRVRDPFLFTGNDGCKIDQSIKASDVLKIFESVVNDNIIKFICDETNDYAGKFIFDEVSALRIKKRSRLNQWKDVSVEEFRLFEGVLLLMGIVQKPTLQSYFSRNPLVNTPIFHEMMKKDRFLLILKFLHFSHSTDANNKLYKIEKLLSLYKQSFKSVYTPSRDISINESLLLWKGRLSWKIYIHLKQARFGIESFMLCEAKTGYVYDFIVYTGKGTNIPINLVDVDSTKQSHSTNVVLSLMEDLLDKGYFLGIDKYFSSVYLFDYLASHKTDVIGTVRENRKDLPKEVTSAKLKKGETSVQYRNKVMLMKWKDKTDILIMSTIHDATMTTITARGGIEKQKPKVCIDYKDNMPEVDIMDQLLSATNIARTHLKKYYKKIYLRFLDIAVLNSHVIHKKLGGQLTLLQFKLELISYLFSKYGNSTEKNKRGGRPSIVPNPSRLSARHFVKDSPMNGTRRQRRQCVVCIKQKKRVVVQYYCKECNVFLCPTKCFEDYHTKTELP